jgi:1-acyl-sn-glycerol-3-phosphate acyltransferase
MKKLLLIFYTAYLSIVFILLMLIGFTSSFLISIFYPSKATAFLYQYIRFWAGSWMFFAGCKLTVSGEEHIDKNQPYIIVINHSSAADMFPAAMAIKMKYRPLGKIELKKIPIMGFIFEKTLVFVDRSNAESRKKSLEDLRKLLAENISVLIFPEGTRNRTAKPLKDFYDGAFRLAIETQLPILPMVMCNTKAMWSNDEFLIHPIDLKAIYLESIATVGLTEDDIQTLKEKVYRKMEAVLLKEDVLFAGK